MMKIHILMSHLWRERDTIAGHHLVSGMQSGGQQVLRSLELMKTMPSMGRPRVQTGEDLGEKGFTVNFEVMLSLVIIQ